MKAALEVFSEYGIDAATIGDITQRADLGKGTFYRHFADKSEIVACLVEQAIDKLIGKLQIVGQATNVETALEDIINVHCRFFMEHPEEFILLFQGRLFLKLDRQITEQMEGPFSRYLEVIENLLSPFMKEKKDIVRIRRLACAVAGFVFGFFSFAMIGMEAEEIETSIKPLRQSFVKSLSLFLAQ
ncbi:MAG TPA: TetR/AcrR family transcriptional regulator [Anaerohalosphaeraceae bacterium]|nr:TetR/AcrR family transcriptional regulator [Phycisphaerae bacterium]HOK94880.1 TetR/AcrR family transcriptional regulator [Anaerohalosphaeraceae bacterium]HOL31541.1 TetR/AcrR family transcriptional regulator [Anaerohalosphaeraceae bacterium]HOM75651.1 TetR/AcrR family transcriptional regulator [Anaerohalosphaeraceae bacterium]HPC64433.1 TetR/AcrR family transcriptional regulator [Anaerohalosphaeraceae bacterium]